MVKAPDTNRQLEELRRVLLKPEALVDRISPVIADILAEQINQSGDEIARAIAPVIGEAFVIRSIRRGKTSSMRSTRLWGR